MAEVTCDVALLFVANDDGGAASEPTECFKPKAAAMRAEALFAQRRSCRRRRIQPHR
jgi:hypothetical protein